MPYIYKEPDVAYFKQGFNVYNTYAENDYDCPYKYWFSLDNDALEDDEENFDIREFEIYDEYLCIDENFDILTMKGYITKDGWKYKLTEELIANKHKNWKRGE